MSRVEPLVLRVGDEQVLREWGRSSRISAGLAQRARIVLLAAEGESNAQVARLVGVSPHSARLPPTILRETRDIDCRGRHHPDALRHDGRC